MTSSAGLPLEEPGMWVERVGRRAWAAGAPALFLDRDGTINVDTGYPHDPKEVVLRSEVLPAIRAATNAHVAVVVVTNQSGIARGYFGWAEFASVNRRLLDLLAAEGCSVDLVIACAYHETGSGVYRIADHPMRKPNPGMFLLAAELLQLDLSRSIVVGDKPADMQAGMLAGLAAGWLLDGGADPASAFPVRSMLVAQDRQALLDAVAAMAA